MQPFLIYFSILFNYPKGKINKSKANKQTSQIPDPKVKIKTWHPFVMIRVENTCKRLIGDPQTTKQ